MPPCAALFEQGCIMEKLRLDFAKSKGYVVALGDKLKHKDGDNRLIYECNIATWVNNDIADKGWFITSFAEREDKGEQPVPDDFPVMATHSICDCVDPASGICWGDCGSRTIKSWKPDYNRLLKMQAEHDKHNESIIKVIKKVSEMTNEEIVKNAPDWATHWATHRSGRREYAKNGTLKGVIVNEVDTQLVGGLWTFTPLNELETTESVYTQEMKDNGELPSVGMRCEVKYNGGNTFRNAIIKFISNYGIVHADVDTGVEIFCGSIDSVDIRPPKTPEEIDLEEAKKKQIESVAQDINSAMLEIDDETIDALACILQERGHLAEVVISDLSSRGMGKV